MAKKVKFSIGQKVWFLCREISDKDAIASWPGKFILAKGGKILTISDCGFVMIHDKDCVFGTKKACEKAISKGVKPPKEED